MSAKHIISSAAFYFDCDKGDGVPLVWFDRVRQLFDDYNLSPILFTASGGEFQLDDCYVLAEREGDLIKWGTVLRARGRELVEALQSGTIESLGLDSPRPDAFDRSDWRAMVDVSLFEGAFYVGIDAKVNCDPGTLFRRAHDIVKDLLSVRYAIAYSMPAMQHPDSYATGPNITLTLSKFREMIQSRQKGPLPKSADELWRDELIGDRRHLTGLFRGAYTANLLSDSHIRTAALTSRGIGKLSRFDQSLWLWELSDSELPIAQDYLESRGVLVSQTVENEHN